MLCCGPMRIALIALLALALGGGCFVDRSGRSDEDAGCVFTGPEVPCDGVDNDCDPTTMDGADGQPCDSDDDDDRCLDDLARCVGGEPVCENLDDGGSTRELCDGIDNDCDGADDDGEGEPFLGMSCEEAGLCGQGHVICAATELRCDEVRTDLEECNAIDDDCDGLIDEAPACPCDLLPIASRRYLFCNYMQSRAEAQLACDSWGYDLVTIDNATEQAGIAARAEPRSVEGWWTGLKETSFMSGSFVWESTAAAPSFTNWQSREPGWVAGIRCAATHPQASGSAAVGGWKAGVCAWNLRFICEQRD